MGSAQVQQLQAPSAPFRRALDICAPDSVAVPGIAGGSGLVVATGSGHEVHLYQPDVVVHAIGLIK